VIVPPAKTAGKYFMHDFGVFAPHKNWIGTDLSQQVAGSKLFISSTSAAGGNATVDVR
jgi:hypothetical protein